MFFFVVLQFAVVVAIIVLVLCQNSEDSVSDFVSSRPGSFSNIGGMNFLCKLTWVCIAVFFLNTMILGVTYSSRGGISKLEAIEDENLNVPADGQKDNVDRVNQ